MEILRSEDLTLFISRTLVRAGGDAAALRQSMVSEEGRHMSSTRTDRPRWVSSQRLPSRLIAMVPDMVSRVAVQASPLVVMPIAVASAIARSSGSTVRARP
jgi:hypothetical protein